MVVLPALSKPKISTRTSFLPAAASSSQCRSTAQREDEGANERVSVCVGSIGSALLHSIGGARRGGANDPAAPSPPKSDAVGTAGCAAARRLPRTPLHSPRAVTAHASVSPPVAATEELGEHFPDEQTHDGRRRIGWVKADGRRRCVVGDASVSSCSCVCALCVSIVLLCVYGCGGAGVGDERRLGDAAE